MSTSGVELLVVGPSQISHAPSLRDSAQEYARGIAGGILFSLPMLYTMEVWWTGFLASPLRLLGYVGISFLLLLGYNRFAGMRADSSFLEVAIDSIEEMGLGIVIAAAVLLLLGRVTASMSLSEIVSNVTVEAMTVAIGVSVGTAQLGGAPKEKRGLRGDSGEPHTTGQLVLALCGAVLLAANVAPTEEILVIASEISPIKQLGLVALSVLVGTLILHQSDFVGSHEHVRRGDGFWMAFGWTISYAAALFASAVMLWFFGRFEGASAALSVSLIVVLAFPAMLGASAGRLLIQ